MAKHILLWLVRVLCLCQITRPGGTGRSTLGSLPSLSPTSLTRHELLWHSPNKDGPLCPSSDHHLPTGCVAARGHIGCMSPPYSHRDTLLIVPQLHRLIVAHADEIVPSGTNGNVIQGSFERPLHLPDQRGVMRLPVANLTIRASCEDLHSSGEVPSTRELGLGGDYKLPCESTKKKDSNELLYQLHYSHFLRHIPHNARAIAGRGQNLIPKRIKVDRGHGCRVLLQHPD